jgi:hypothetical protein
MVDRRGRELIDIGLSDRSRFKSRDDITPDEPELTRRAGANTLFAVGWTIGPVRSGLAEVWSTEGATD